MISNENLPLTIILCPVKVTANRPVYFEVATGDSALKIKSISLPIKEDQKKNRLLTHRISRYMARASLWYLVSATGYARNCMRAVSTGSKKLKALESLV